MRLWVFVALRRWCSCGTEDDRMAPRHSGRILHTWQSDNTSYIWIGCDKFTQQICPWAKPISSRTAVKLTGEEGGEIKEEGTRRNPPTSYMVVSDVRSSMAAGGTAAAAAAVAAELRTRSSGSRWEETIGPVGGWDRWDAGRTGRSPFPLSALCLQSTTAKIQSMLSYFRYLFRDLCRLQVGNCKKNASLSALDQENQTRVHPPRQLNIISMI